MSEEKAGKANPVAQLTVANRAQYASTFRALIKGGLATLHALPIADGRLPFPTRVGTVNSNGEPDPTGMIPPPVLPAPNAAQNAWSYYNAVNGDIDRLARERAEWSKLERAGLMFVVGALGDDVKRLATIKDTMASLPQLFAAVEAFTRGLEAGDIAFYNRQYEAFSQQPDELVRAYATRFQELVTDMTERGCQRPDADIKRVFAKGLRHHGGTDLTAYACFAGVTFADLVETAGSIENDTRSSFNEGQYGSSVVCSEVCYAQSAHANHMVQPYPSKKDIVCYNCNRKGHYARDCWSTAGEKRNFASSSSSSSSSSGPPAKFRRSTPATSAGTGHNGGARQTPSTPQSTIVIGARPSQQQSRRNGAGRGDGKGRGRYGGRHRHGGRVGCNAMASSSAATNNVDSSTQSRGGRELDGATKL